MTVISKSRDAFGQMMIDYLNGHALNLIIERDDGFVAPGGHEDIYFAEFKDWPARQRKAVRFARGRVLDIGCGAGRCLLYLQRKGLQVVGIDNSPLAVKACKMQGAHHVMAKSFTEIKKSMGIFDSIVLFGNNFALFGNIKRAKWMLKKLYGITPANGRIIAEACDPYKTTIKEHLEYHKRNRKRGLPSGLVKVRVRYKKLISPWFDLLLVSEKEMKKILEGTGWQITKTFQAKNDMFYAVVLEKKQVNSK
ncbi:MAG: methyltransferase domain-containing protein [FCB group bacterium]|nr:methyltransferase domain-containing protein [FCB group bacterium]